MSATDHRKVAVSYAWDPESNGPSAGKVEAFCKHLHSLGVPVLRDVDGLKLGDSLSAFMGEIGTSDYVCVFLSEAYLKSPNCMHELLVAWDNTRHKPAAFRQQVKVWVMEDARDAFKPEGRLKWANYWCAERDRIEPLIRGRVADGLAAAELDAFNRVKKFADSVNEILCYVADTLSPRSVDELQAWATAEFPPLTPEEEAQQLAEIFAGTTEGIDRILADHAKVAEFLAKTCPEVIQSSAGTVRLADSARTRQFGGRKHLKSIKDKIHTFTGSPLDWDRLRQVVGGLAVMSVDRQWVLLQRNAWNSGGAEFPGEDTLLSMHDDRSACILPLLTAALADGYAKLPRVFGENDPRLLDDPPQVLRGLGPDREREYKLHLIHAVLKPAQKGIPIRENDPAWIDARFDDVQEALEIAAKEENDPYYTHSATMHPLAPLIRPGLPLQHLLLLRPKRDGNLREAVADPVHLFSYLHDIFETIQRRLNSTSQS